MPLRQVALRADDSSRRLAPYEAATYRALATIREALQLSPSDVVFDVGCGAGRAVVVFGRSQINGSVGVELNSELAARAEDNARKVRLRQAEIQIISADATSVEYSNATAIFMFNPFSEAIMRRFVHKLLERNAHENLRIAYMNPLHSSIIQQSGSFELSESRTVRHLSHRVTVEIWRRIRQ